MAKGVHRVAAGTKMARKMMARAKNAMFPTLFPVTPTPEQRAWNAQVEAKRKAKEKE